MNLKFPNKSRSWNRTWIRHTESYGRFIAVRAVQCSFCLLENKNMQNECAVSEKGSNCWNYVSQSRSGVVLLQYCLELCSIGIENEQYGCIWNDAQSLKGVE